MIFFFFCNFIFYNFIFHYSFYFYFNMIFYYCIIDARVKATKPQYQRKFVATIKIKKKIYCKKFFYGKSIVLKNVNLKKIKTGEKKIKNIFYIESLIKLWQLEKSLNLLFRSFYIFYFKSNI